MISIGYITQTGEETLVSSHNSMLDAETALLALKTNESSNEDITHFFYASGDNNWYVILGTIDPS